MAPVRNASSTSCCAGRGMPASPGAAGARNGKGRKLHGCELAGQAHLQNHCHRIAPVDNGQASTCCMDIMGTPLCNHPPPPGASAHPHGGRPPRAPPDLRAPPPCCPPGCPAAAAAQQTRLVWGWGCPPWGCQRGWQPQGLLVAVHPLPALPARAPWAAQAPGPAPWPAPWRRPRTPPWCRRRPGLQGSEWAGAADVKLLMHGCSCLPPSAACALHRGAWLAKSAPRKAHLAGSQRRLLCTGLPRGP